MCGPQVAAAAAAAGLSALGSYQDSREQHRNQTNMINARNAATQAELTRQTGSGNNTNKMTGQPGAPSYQQRAADEFNLSLDAFRPQAQADALVSGQTGAANAFLANAPTREMVGSITSASAPRVVAAHEGNRVADAFGRLDQQNRALGDLTGWTQRAFDNNINLGRRGGNIDTISDFARNSARVNQVEQEADQNNAFRPPSGIGSIFRTLGQVGANYAGRGNFGGTPGMPAPGATLPQIRMGGLY